MKIKSKHFTEQEFIEAVKTSHSIKECLRKLDLASSGTSYTIFHSRVKALELDISHFGVSAIKRDYINFNKREFEEILVENSPNKSLNNLKKRLIKEGLLHYSCSKCGISEWNGAGLSLHLDHVNGISNDNRIENLRLLCPNCHSQTETYAGKNIKKKKKTYNCVDCGVEITRDSTRCVPCNLPITSAPKIEWPSVEELTKMVGETSYLAVSRKLGVSDSAIRKHIRVHSKKEK
jgi:predicted RNA-binding Zn-ribbon protein involved in translation (DUF1610 family)